MLCSTEVEQKLPTASAVVADIVDIAKHLHRNIMISWSSKKLNLIDCKKAESRFFVRATDSEADVTSVFGDVEIIRFRKLQVK